ncbi:M28 family peptidase, partial [Bacteriovoracaceae bacterium]|nr:M28 family peptidase [Bacteriovoracaceae bacterium]
NDQSLLGPIFGTLISSDVSITIPVISVSFSTGEKLKDLSSATLVVNTSVGHRVARNIFAETKTGRSNKVILVSSRLDSTVKGPGVQSPGSGAATTLEIAIQLSKNKFKPRNKIRFAWWGGSDAINLGSRHYFQVLTKKLKSKIAVSLNFNTLGSPNFARFAYDGDGSHSGVTGPRGSSKIEKVFQDYFSSKGQEILPISLATDLDFEPFRTAKIPVGGLFSGTVGIKSNLEESIFGGTVGDQYDPCFNLACDTFDNVSLTSLDQLSDAATHAVVVFAKRKKFTKIAICRISNCV